MEGGVPGNTEAPPAYAPGMQHNTRNIEKLPGDEARSHIEQWLTAFAIAELSDICTTYHMWL